MYLANDNLCLQLHHEKECPAYPVVCEKCSKDGIPRAKVHLFTKLKGYFIHIPQPSPQGLLGVQNGGSKKTLENSRPPVSKKFRDFVVSNWQQAL